MTRGSVHYLPQTCHGFAAGMIKFFERMGGGMLGTEPDHIVGHLRTGTRANLLEMIQVTYVKSRMARILQESGLKKMYELLPKQRLRI